MKKTFKVLSAQVILFCTGLACLLLVNTITKPLVAETENNVVEQKLRSVIAAATYLTVIPDTLWKAYDSLNNPVGIVFRTFPAGYAGPIPMTVGLDLQGQITGILIGDKSEGFAETPGLGVLVTRSAFTKQFIGKPGISAAIKKDGGEIDAISGATISSRAVCSGIKKGSEVYSSCLAVPAADDIRIKVLPTVTEFVELIKDTLWLGTACAETVGIVFIGQTMGYLDSIRFIAGIDTAGNITGFEILYSKETEGIGEKIRGREFLDEFKDGTPDAITGATISSRALIKSVQENLERFKHYSQ